MKKQQPKIGIFYYYNDIIIAPAHYQKLLDPITYAITLDIRLNNPGEHRDLWDEYILHSRKNISR